MFDASIKEQPEVRPFNELKLFWQLLEAKAGYKFSSLMKNSLELNKF